jgi:hypothetical protein
MNQNTTMNYYWHPHSRAHALSTAASMAGFSLSPRSSRPYAEISGQLPHCQRPLTHRFQKCPSRPILTQRNLSQAAESSPPPSHIPQTPRSQSFALDKRVNACGQRHRSRTRLRPSLQAPPEVLETACKVQHWRHQTRMGSIAV